MLTEDIAFVLINQGHRWSSNLGFPTLHAEQQCNTCMSKYCQYISAEFCRYDTSATFSYRLIYIGVLIHRSSSKCYCDNTSQCYMCNNLLCGNTLKLFFNTFTASVRTYCTRAASFALLCNSKTCRCTVLESWSNPQKTWQVLESAMKIKFLRFFFWVMS